MNPDEACNKLKHAKSHIQRKAKAKVGNSMSRNAKTQLGNSMSPNAKRPTGQLDVMQLIFVACWIPTWQLLFELNMHWSIHVHITVHHCPTPYPINPKLP